MRAPVWAIVTACGCGRLGFDSVPVVQADASPVTCATPEFAMVATIPVTPMPYGIAIADLDGDAHVDIFVVGAGNMASVLLGNGDGTFRAHADYPTGTYGTAVRVADLDHDGKLDVAIAMGDAPGTSVLLGNGDGTFRPYAIYGTAGRSYSIALGDVDGDGNIDLAIGAYDVSVATVLLGRGDGTFGGNRDLTVGGNPQVALAATRASGPLDMLVANEADGTVDVLLGNGQNLFQLMSSVSVSSPRDPHLADLDRDGTPDLVVASYGPGVSVARGNGDGTFGASVLYSGGPLTKLAIADVNGDGLLDVLAVDDSSNTLTILLGNGDTTLQSAVTFPSGSQPEGLAIGDLDGNGTIDAVTANYNEHSVSVFSNTCR